jgi:dTDP-4-amino-4,6-dideoxygalactose transaminase
MSDVLAAFLYAQLDVWQDIQARRRRIWEYYDQQLRDWAGERGIGCPAVPPHCEQSYHMYYLVMPSLEQRQAFISQLRSVGILSVFHYVPLHLSPMGQYMGGQAGSCPVSEQVSERLVRLPFYNGLSPSDQDRVIAAVRQFTP